MAIKNKKNINYVILDVFLHIVASCYYWLSLIVLIEGPNKKKKIISKKYDSCKNSLKKISNIEFFFYIYHYRC